MAALAGGCSGSVGAPTSAGVAGQSGSGSAGSGAAGSGANIGGGGGSGSTPTDCQNPMPATVSMSPLQRLSRNEYVNTTNDLIGNTPSVATTLPIDDQNDLAAGARSLIVSNTWLSDAMQAGADLAHTAVQNLGTLLPCSAAGADACAQQFIESFGKRAFRRPLAPTETTRLMAIYALGRTNVNFAHGIELVIQAMLLSPNFLYKIELGVPGSATGGQLKLTPYEVASRLSYMFWGTMPDSILFAAADMGKLGNGTDVRAQALRMVGSPLARETLIYLHKRWLDLDQIAVTTKDATTYPNFGPDMMAAMDTEAHNFLDSVVWPQGSGLQALLTSTTTSVNSMLAGLYGVTVPAGSTAFTQVQLNPAQRSGVLTLTSTIAVHTFADTSEPVHRGKFVRERFLCTTIPDPPATVMATPPDPAPGIPIRDKFAQHSSGAACQPCHQLMDPIGFGFEHYDGLGVWRDTEQGKPVDATGNIVLSTDVNGPFDGIPNLARKLLQSDQVKNCVVSTFVGLTRGAELAADTCTVKQLRRSYDAAGGDVRAVLVDLTALDSFYARPVLAGEVLP
jgi:Protein of unknown function (DUF1592)/Protein of unknown function (DUF1588)/Protein of unknown function (DUF1595)/Protein of unknown function (DUF1587)